jgi:hypothetical protein
MTSCDFTFMPEWDHRAQATQLAMSIGTMSVGIAQYPQHFNFSLAVQRASRLEGPSQ